MEEFTHKVKVFMKIGYDAKRVFHNWRGLGNYSRDLVTGLSHYFPGHEYILYSMDFKDERSVDFEQQNEQFIIRKPEGFISKLFPSVWRSRLSRYFQMDELDIFHGLSHELPKKVKGSKTKCIVTIHDLIFIRYPEYFPAIDRKVYMAKVRYACKTAEVVVAICEQTKTDLIDLLDVDASKIRVAYQSCNKIYFDETSEEKRKKVLSEYGITSDYFLYVGAFEERKNILNLIEAYFHYGTQKKLVLVGRGNKYLKKINKRIIELGLEKDILIIEGAPLEHLPVLYQGAFAFCFPSHFEGFGIPIIESLFSKTPVITTNGSCFPEVAGPGGLYCDPNKPFEIAKAMNQLTENEDTYNQLVNDGYEFVQKFRPEVTSSNLMKIYQDIVSK